MKGCSSHSKHAKADKAASAFTLLALHLLIMLSIVMTRCHKYHSSTPTDSWKVWSLYRLFLGHVGSRGQGGISLHLYRLLGTAVLNLLHFRMPSSNTSSGHGNHSCQVHANLAHCLANLYVLHKAEKRARKSHTLHLHEIGHTASTIVLKVCH